MAKDSIAAFLRQSQAQEGDRKQRLRVFRPEDVWPSPPPALFFVEEISSLWLYWWRERKGIRVHLSKQRVLVVSGLDMIGGDESHPTISVVDGSMRYCVSRDASAGSFENATRLLLGYPRRDARADTSRTRHSFRD
jgi:hypothetical protein